MRFSLILAGLICWPGVSFSAPQLVDDSDPPFRKMHQQAVKALLDWCPALRQAKANVLRIKTYASFSLPDWPAGKVGWDHYLNIDITVGDNSAFVPASLANNPNWTSLHDLTFMAGSGVTPGVMTLGSAAPRFYCRDQAGQPLSNETFVPVPGMAVLKGLAAEFE